MYILLVNNVVVQKQPNMAPGFVWTDKDAVCGQILENELIIDGVIISGEFVNPAKPDLTVEAAQVELNNLYDVSMLTLQNGYSNEEVKTFAVKQDAIREYVAGGISGLSAENRSMIEALTGSTDDLVLSAKLDNMVAANATFKNYLALIERARDIHVDQLVDDVDNSAIVASLSAAYAALGG
jgi:hypothetical protein